MSLWLGWVGCVPSGGEWAGAPAPAEVGEPIGEAVTAVLGPDGGELVSADGALRLVVPEGALAEDTELSVQPITNTAWGGLGDGYRLAPAVAFDVPATLELGWTEAEESGTAAELLGIAVQDEDGYWRPFADGDVDVDARTMSVALDAIAAPVAEGRGAAGSADFARHWRLRLDPAEATVKRGALLNLSLQACTVVDDLVWPFGNGGGGALGPPAAYTHSGPVTWSAGLGTVTGGRARATYRAPRTLPAATSTLVTARFEIGGQSFTPSSRVNLADEVETWVGTARQTAAPGITLTFDVTWTLDETTGPVQRFVPTGEAKLAMDSPCTLSPKKHEIVDTNGHLEVDTSVDPPKYAGVGTITWQFTQQCGAGQPIPGTISGTFLGSDNPDAPIGDVKFELRDGEQVAVIRDSRTFGGMVVDWEFVGE